MEQTKKLVIDEEDEFLEKPFDFSRAVPNPYYKKVTDEVTFRLGKDVIAYFKQLAEKKEMSFDRVINMYLYECMINNHEPHFPWEDEVKEYEE